MKLLSRYVNCIQVIEPTMQNFPRKETTTTMETTGISSTYHRSKENKL